MFISIFAPFSNAYSLLRRFKICPAQNFKIFRSLKYALNNIPTVHSCLKLTSKLWVKVFTIFVLFSKGCGLLCRAKIGSAQNFLHLGSLKHALDNILKVHIIPKSTSSLLNIRSIFKRPSLLSTSRSSWIFLAFGII